MIKPITGYEGLYSVCDDGRVYSHVKNKYLKGRIQARYLAVGLYRAGTMKDVPIHRLVAQAFIENPFNKPDVNHKNGNRMDNGSDNLEWATAQENTIHSWDSGLSKYTPSLKRAIATSAKCRKFSHEQEQNIINLYKVGHLQSELATAFNCSRHTIMRIVNHRHKINASMIASIGRG